MMSKYSRIKLPSLGVAKLKNVFSEDLPKFDTKLLTLKEIDRGAFGSVSETTYNDTRVVVKQLLPSLATNSEYLLSFNKEASLLHSLDHPGIVKLIGVCEAPLSIMMELCEFSLIPFNREVSFYSLDSLLQYFHSEGLFSHFPGLGHIIATQIADAIAYMHSIDMVHRDIKPANILVSNLHYVGRDNFEEIFQVSPILCKIGDLGESRSVVIRTKKMTENARTRYVDRGSTAFMAPEILLENQKLETAGIEDLKMIDVWALLLTFWVILNPDQKWPFYYEIKSNVSIESLLEKKTVPSSSNEYEPMQSSEMALLRDVFYSSFKYSPAARKSAREISLMLKVKQSIQIHPLEISQASALEESDRRIALSIQEGLDNDDLDTKPPEDDATNSCAFLSLGIIDMLTEKDLSVLSLPELQKHIEDVIKIFPLHFNNQREAEFMYDAEEAYKILQNSGQLRHKFNLEEDYINKHAVFSYSCQKQIHDKFQELIQKASDVGKPMFAIFQSGKFVFSSAVTSAGEIFIFETHPIPEVCGGDGNGVIVKCSTVTETLEWVFSRLISSGVDSSSIAYVIEVEIVGEDSYNIEEYATSSDEEIIEVFSSDDDDPDKENTDPNRSALTQETNNTTIRECGNNKVYTRSTWENVETEEVPKVPFDIDGLKHYVIIHPERTKLLLACRDGRKWVKDKPTHWSGFSNVRYKDCNGGYVCPNYMCELSLGYKNYWYFQNGLCITCKATKMRIPPCDARRYTAYVGEKEAHVFHVGIHDCKATPLKADVSKGVQDSLAVNPYIKPAAVQTANILDAITNRIPPADLMEIVRTFTDRRTISNELKKARKVIDPIGSSFDALRSLKEYSDQVDPYLLRRIDEDRNTVFKTSTLQLQMAKEMSTIVTTGLEEMSLRSEFCCFDGQHKRVKGYVTLTASVYHPMRRKQVPLATMETIHEDTDSVEYFWREFNSAYKECNDTEEKFLPTGWISDLAGANFVGLERIYGEDIREKIKACEFHFKQQVNRRSTQMDEDQTVRFKRLSNDLLGACTPEAFNATANDMQSFLRTYNSGEFDGWFLWWLDRKESLFRAFRSYTEPRMNQAEVVHAGRVHRDPFGVTLLDAFKFDMRDSLLLISEGQGMENGTFSGGCGPSAAERNARIRSTEMEAADRLGQDILIHGVEPSRKRKITSEDSFKPPNKKSKKRTQQMINNRIAKAQELQNIMKICSVKVVSNLKRVYMVKNKATSKVLNKVEICLTPTCTCKDFEKHKTSLNCVHIIFVLVHALRCTADDVVMKKSISDMEIDSVFKNGPAEVPEELLMANKPKITDYNERQRLLRQHPLYGTEQNAEIQVKTGRRASCRFCKKKIEVNQVCLKVYNVLLIPYTSDSPTTQDMYFCPKRSCFKKCHSYMHVSVPNTIPCTPQITDDQFQLLPDDINACRQWEHGS